MNVDLPTTRTSKTRPSQSARAQSRSTWTPHAYLFARFLVRFLGSIGPRNIEMEEQPLHCCYGADSESRCVLCRRPIRNLPRQISIRDEIFCVTAFILGNACFVVGPGDWWFNNATTTANMNAVTMTDLHEPPRRPCHLLSTPSHSSRLGELFQHSRSR